MTDSDGPASFHDIGDKYGTDKVKERNYWFLYDKYLPPIRNQRVKMLEIGLGCDMADGPGASYYTWLEYFSHVELYYIESDAECARKWAAKTTGAKIYVGGLADKSFLHTFIDETGGEFDLVIDGGGHRMSQQMTLLEMLWKIIKPGGMYFVEDLETSYVDRLGGDQSGGKDSKIKTMAKYIYELMDDMFQADGAKHTIGMHMRGIECQRQICVFVKKDMSVI
ncbi:hypothetical protein JX266_012174 [Neoarthrinium moseri]|uniref:uncharacterized protein n=1 Tax=Neoarthrinium moseri TaxID=1658444 RepID=UPI001FDE47CC|nr:uncharacterized protein JN550_003200 [Neoarthrinium moseri]KAI1841621.1 hypothetical protein JX266_012174 [Neoarthrinium moseri]KAI1873931.1 hypothetical protein JN550_003200 [Neoarthrinium moseri]